MKNETMINRAWDGISVLLDHYAEIRPGDSVILVYTPECRECSAWVACAIEQRGIDLHQGQTVSKMMSISIGWPIRVG